MRSPRPASKSGPHDKSAAAPALAEVVRRRGAVVDALSWVPSAAGSSAGRHRRLATILHPRFLLPAEPRAALEDVAARPGGESAPWELRLPGRGAALPSARPSAAGAASRAGR